MLGALTYLLSVIFILTSYQKYDKELIIKINVLIDESSKIFKYFPKINMHIAFKSQMATK